MEKQNQVALSQPSGNLSLIEKIKTQVKMRELPERKPILQVLGKCFVMVGLSENNIPDGLAKDVLVNFAVECYGDLNHEEIETAFKLALTGKLGLNDTNCYQNFSCEYLGKIMAAYYKWRSKELMRPQKSADEEPEPMSDEDWFKIMLIEPYEKTLKGGAYTWSPLQEKLISARLYDIGFRFIISESEKEELMIIAREETIKPKGLLTVEKKREYDKDLERALRGITFRTKIREKMMDNFDIRTHVLNRLKQIENKK